MRAGLQRGDGQLCRAIGCFEARQRRLPSAAGAARVIIDTRRRRQHIFLHTSFCQFFCVVHSVPWGVLPAAAVLEKEEEDDDTKKPPPPPQQQQQQQQPWASKCRTLHRTNGAAPDACKLPLVSSFRCRLFPLPPPPSSSSLPSSHSPPSALPPPPHPHHFATRSQAGALTGTMNSKETRSTLPLGARLTWTPTTSAAAGTRPACPRTWRWRAEC